MEWPELLGFVITAFIAVFGSYSATKRSFDERERRNEHQQAQQAADIARLEAKLDALKSEVEKHNQVMERTFKLEQDMKNIYYRIDDLKEANK